MSFFSNFTLIPEDPILSLPVAFTADSRLNKVNLGIGAYKTAEGKSLVLTSVQEAEQLILKKQTNKDYLPIDGDKEFLKHALQLLLGKEMPILNSDCLFAAQTVGGSGALRVGGELLSQLKTPIIFLSEPSWPNHQHIFQRAGLTIKSYPYLDPVSCQLDFDGMVNAIKNMPPFSIILLHGCCHNPTGVNPSFEQWKELSRVVKKHQIIPFFDIAYQGFGEDLNKDAESIRYFVNEGHEMLIAYSFAKNFGLYGERVGFLAVISSHVDVSQRVGSQVKSLIRGNYSTPPVHGAKIVSTVLSSPPLYSQWEHELANMRDRVKEMRAALIATLLAKDSNKDYSYMYQQSGLFSFCGLTPDQVIRLRHEKGIYMPTNGRINIAGLNTQNMNYVAESFLAMMD